MMKSSKEGLSNFRRSLSGLLAATALALPVTARAETVGVFFDPAVEQIKFAAGDVKSALEMNKFTVEMLPVASLNTSYPNKKIVVALASDRAVADALAAEGGEKISRPGEQAYVLRTTEVPQRSYWVLGGDVNGAMYGGLQLAGNISLRRFQDAYELEESPAILRRGIKLNLPFDKESQTYGKSSVSGISNAIFNVWDMSFWTAWFDEMARNRYNVISIWSNHPFTSMIKLPDYPDVAIQDVTDCDGNRKVLSIDRKIDFWKEVMAYAKSRGFNFYLVTWNIFTDGATGKYGITDEQEVGATNPATIEYMRKCMTALLETYPDLDGFGITQGEHMSWNVGPRQGRLKQNEINDGMFLANTYGKGVLDYAKRHPERMLTFIHRWHLADFTDINRNFGELMALPNVTFEMSYKYSLAHMHSIPLPERMNDRHIKPLLDHQLKSWLTLRNDDFYYHNWGDPGFVRAYINGIIEKGDWVAGFNIGSDGYCPTRTFFSKNSVSQGLLEVQRQWYLFMLWGRLAYNPATPDSVFINHMALQYPGVSSAELFKAWTFASGGLPKVAEIITGTLGRDNQWWPEACQSADGFLTVSDFGNANAEKGSALCSIEETASGRLDGKTSAFDVADEIEEDALSALSIVSAMSAEPDTELGAAIGNIRAMSFLTIYYAHKIRGAIYMKANEPEKARDSLGTAYGWWIKYSTLMDSMYYGMTMPRTADLPDWHAYDQSVLREYTDLGGVGIPAIEGKSSK